MTTLPPPAPDRVAEYRGGAWTRAAGIVLTLAAALLLAAPLGWWMAGANGLWSACLAALICLAGSLVSIVIGCFSATPADVHAHVVFGMFVRMMLSLVACLAIYSQGGWPVEGGMVYFLLAYYPLSLGVETAQDVVAIQSLFSASAPDLRAPHHG